MSGKALRRFFWVLVGPHIVLFILIVGSFALVKSRNYNSICSSALAAGATVPDDAELDYTCSFSDYVSKNIFDGVLAFVLLCFLLTPAIALSALIAAVTSGSNDEEKGMVAGFVENPQLRQLKLK